VLREANNGDEALSWCKQKIADVLETNIELPRMVDGWQIAERLSRAKAAGDLCDWIFAGSGPSSVRSVSLQKPIIRKRSCRP
jgi:CheY-like chemotaxis protein